MRMLRAVVSALAVGAICMSTMAQNNNAPPPGGRGRGPAAGPRTMLPPEKAKNAWELEAKNVAKNLNLNSDQTAAVVKAYSEARESHAAAMDKLRRDMMDKMRDAQGDDNEDMAARRAEMQKAFADLNKSERDKLSANLAKTINADQTKKAMEPLGTFNPNWDMMVSTIAGFNLDQAKQDQAIQATQDYVVATTSAMEGGDREKIRTANQEAHKKLTDTMKGLLSEEQFGQFERASGGPGMRRGGPRPGGDDANPPRGRGGRRGGNGGGDNGGGDDGGR